MSLDFAAYVTEQIRTIGSAAQLARNWGVSEMQISRWQGGQDIRLSTLQQLLARIGGDVLRAFPGWQPEAAFPGIPIAGRVNAGTLEYHTVSDPHSVAIDPDAFRASRYWGLTAGPVVLAEIQGDSMSPDYASGDIIACRAPASVDTLPDRTPCVFSDRSSGETFKLLRRAKNKQIVAQPLNPEHPLITFSDGVKIRYVALGKLSGINPRSR